MNFRNLTAALLVSLATLGIAACGSGEDGETGGDGAAASRLPEIGNDRGPEEYREVVYASLALLDEYWSEQLAAEGEDSQPPRRLISYWSRGEDVGCGGEPAGAYNAQYCPLSDTISWDGNWLYEDLFLLAGDAAVAFLLAHEYGHLVQNRLGAGNEFAFTIEEELNADCLAGAWFGAVDEHVAELSDEDYEALYGAVLDVADPAGVPWVDPTAHGNADQRGAALLFGGEEGPHACFNRFGPGSALE